MLNFWYSCLCVIILSPWVWTRLSDSLLTGIGRRDTMPALSWVIKRLWLHIWGDFSLFLHLTLSFSPSHCQLPCHEDPRRLTVRSLCLGTKARQKPHELAWKQIPPAQWNLQMGLQFLPTAWLRLLERAWAKGFQLNNTHIPEPQKLWDSKYSCFFFLMLRSFKIIHSNGLPVRSRAYSDCLICILAQPATEEKQ